MDYLKRLLKQENLIAVRNKVAASDREYLALETTLKEMRKKLRTLEKKKYLIENYFKAFGYGSDAKNYEFLKWRAWATLKLAEEQVRIIVESVFSAILQEPIRTKMMHALENQTSSLDVMEGARQKDQLVELAGPITQQISDNEIRKEFERLTYKLRKDMNLEVQGPQGQEPDTSIGHN